MRFILGPAIFILGILLMKYTVQVTNFTGKIDFAEKYLRSGLAGTYTWWRLVGFAACCLAVAWMFGYLDLFGSIDKPIGNGY